ncbi:MAG: response regulator [Anaerolineales bacterium]|nr:response regulator [Anaerolineales bacterium]
MNNSTNSQPATVAVIDDAKEVLLHLTLILKRAGYRVVTAVNGREGLSLIQNEHPDIILCDIMMPPPNGFEVRKTLMRDPVTAAIPFIFLTARSAQVDKLTGIECGADDYITKPFDTQELLARIHALLRRTALSRQQGLAEAKAEIDRLGLTIFDKTSQEFRPLLDRVLAALTLTLTERFAGNPRQQKRFVQIALDSAYRLHALVQEMANSEGQLRQDQMDAFMSQVVELETDFYKLVE